MNRCINPQGCCPLIRGVGHGDTEVPVKFGRTFPFPLEAVNILHKHTHYGSEVLDTLLTDTPAPYRSGTLPVFEKCGAAACCVACYVINSPGGVAC